MLDSGSEISILSSRAAQKLGLRGETVIIETIGVGGVSTQQVTKKVNVTIEDKMGRKSTFEAIVLDKACGDALQIPKDKLMKLCKKLSINPKTLYTNGGEVDLLLGMNVAQLLEQTRLSEDTAGCGIMETRFGLCIVGKVN